MDLNKKICDAESASGRLGYNISKKAVYGSSSSGDMVTLLRLNSYIRALKRSVPIKRKVIVPSNEVQTVSFSSLKKRNNTLILEHPRVNYKCVEIRPCLSEEEICKILQLIQVICMSID